MALENDPSSRMQIRSRGELLHPGSCSCCGSSDEERSYVDMGIFYDYEGQIYFCNLCITQAAEILGMYTPEQVAETHAIANEALAKIELLSKELEDAKSYADSLNSVLTARVLAGSDPVGFIGPQSEVTDESTEPTPDESGTGESEVTEHDSGTGRPDTPRAKPRNVKPAKPVFK